MAFKKMDPSLGKFKAIFLDRDGVINQKPLPHDYVKSWQEFKFLPKTAEAVKRLNQDFLVVVVTNQRGLARGLIKWEDLRQIHQKMAKALKAQQAFIDAVYVCPHNEEENCSCRKPKPGLVLKAAQELNIDLTASYLVGDSASDIEAGKSAGCFTIYLEGNPEEKEAPQADLKAKNLYEAVDLILEKEKQVK